MAKTVDKTSFVQVHNTYIPHKPAMGKHEYTTSAGRFMYVYTKLKGIVPMSTICGLIYTVLYHFWILMCGHVWDFLFDRI